MLVGQAVEFRESTLVMNIAHCTGKWKQGNKGNKDIRRTGRMPTGERKCEGKVNKEYFKM